MPSLIRLLRARRSDLLAVGVLLILPLLWFAPVLFAGLTLLPYDNLYAFEPWRSLYPNLIPHNELLSDLVLENAVWKLHIRRALEAGQIPLWNSDLFTGVPFFAAGQSSSAYPLSILFYLFPLDVAYGWFTAIQIGIAGVNLYLLTRVLGARPAAAAPAGLIFQFSGFLIASVVFTMVIAAVAWLPALLALIERILQKQEEKGDVSFRPVPYVAVGAGLITLTALAGHPEFFYYTMLVAGLYSACRLVVATRHMRSAATGPSSWLRTLRLAGWLLLMALLGIAGGGVQLLPLYDLVQENFRVGSASFEDVLGWAWPDRHLLTFFFPNIFGNPSHHAWFDLWNLRWMPASQNALGEEIHTIFWGIKNYVEGASYLGLLTWLLAGAALLGLFPRRRNEGDPGSSVGLPARVRKAPILIFAALAIVSLLFAFGTPLYAILFYGLPGWDQLHSPFRWVFPFTLSMAVLAGLGLETILRSVGRSRLLQSPAQPDLDATSQPSAFRFGLLCSAALLSALFGLGLLVAVAASFVIPDPFVELGERIVAGSDLARSAFADGRIFWGYQSVNLVHAGVAALASSLFLLWLIRGPRRELLVGLVAMLIVGIDLFGAHGRFNPATDPALSPLRTVPPVVEFIQARERERGDEVPGLLPWRFTTFNQPGEKTFNANVGMYYGWQDIRGYDSIIPAGYVGLMTMIADQSGELLYNRIAPLYATGPNPYASLENPLLDLLGVRYLFTTSVVPNAATWSKIYEDASVRVYENQEVFPRALIVPEARVMDGEAQPLLTADLRQTIFIEEDPERTEALVPSNPEIADVSISRYTGNDLFVDVNLSDRGWLLVSDAYFPGWKAFVRPFGGGENDETEVMIHRANRGLRAVYLPEAGQWTVRFVYSPMSFKLGLYLSFLAGMTTLLLLLWWGWGRYYRPGGSEDEVQTVAKNSLVPMGLNLANKAIDFAFAMLYVRLLGPTGTGQYAFVVAVYGFFEIVSRYGLGTLLTREVAADKEQSSRYLTNVLGLRTLLWALSMPVLAGVTYLYWSTGSIGRAEIDALIIFAFAMLLANWSDGFSSLFYAFEKMEYPAGLSSALALIKVALGALVLLLGWSFVGLAAVSLLVNGIQLIWIYWLVRRTLFRPEWRWDGALQWWMAKTSGPLMINHLLATIFWRIDLWILRPLAGAYSVGLYSASLKYLDGLNIIPSTFTFAIFPLMSRYARREGEGLLRAYRLSVRLLIMVSLPIALSVTVLAEPLIYILGGAEFLNVPDTVELLGRTFSYRGGSALALQVIIWSIPIGFVNSVTQFVLIAVDQQRYLTKAFIGGVLFNIVGNLLLIPSFDYIGAAVVTILSEFSLLIPFYWRVRQHVGVVSWWDLTWRPLSALIVMAVTMIGLQSWGADVWLALPPGWLAYLLFLAVTGAFRGDEMAVLFRLLPLERLKISHGR